MEPVIFPIPPQEHVILSEAKDHCISFLLLQLRLLQRPSMTTDRAYVYILANGFKHIYTGVTAKLAEHVIEHKNKIHPNCFTTRYNITQLVYFEEHLSVVKAIAREKQIKGWLRIEKIQLIVGVNPTWKDLSEDLLKVPAFDESKMRAPVRF